MQPGDKGDLVRGYEFVGDRLILRPIRHDAKSFGNGSSEPAQGNAAMDVLMPQLGETVAEGKITKWFKSAGEPVKPGDNLFEIETDKVSMEVPSTTTGVLAEIRVPAGDVAPVGAVVAVIAGWRRAAQLQQARRPRHAAAPPQNGRSPAAPSCASGGCASAAR